MNKILKSRFLIVTYGIVLFFIFKNFNFFLSEFYKLSLLLMPFIYGFFIAYFVNWPSVFFEKKLAKFFKQNSAKKKSVIRGISILLSYLCFLLGISFLLIIVIPQVIVSAGQLASKFSDYSVVLKEISQNYSSIASNYFGFDLGIKNQNILKSILNVDMASLFPIAFNYFKNFTVVIYNWLLGIIISIYFITEKEKLISQAKKVIYACFNKKIYNYISYVLNISHTVFGKFIIGKIIDAFIMGILCLIGTSIMQIPYAPIISLVIGITNIIPFFGPFFGAIPSIFIILMISPIKALWFAIFILILQQINGNIIGPKILSESVGISGLFVIFSVIIGGGLFGVPGMVLGVPVFGVIHIMFGKFVNKRLSKNKKKLM